MGGIEKIFRQGWDILKIVSQKKATVKCSSRREKGKKKDLEKVQMNQ
jgi:hypothetical protein